MKSDVEQSLIVRTIVLVIYVIITAIKRIALFDTIYAEHLYQNDTCYRLENDEQHHAADGEVAVTDSKIL